MSEAKRFIEAVRSAWTPRHGNTLRLQWLGDGVEMPSEAALVEAQEAGFIGLQYDFHCKECVAQGRDFTSHICWTSNPNTTVQDLLDEDDEVQCEHCGGIGWGDIERYGPGLHAGPALKEPFERAAEAERAQKAREQQRDVLNQQERTMTDLVLAVECEGVGPEALERIEGRFRKVLGYEYGEGV